MILGTALTAAAVVPESPTRPGGRVNWAAAGLLAGWLVALLLPLSEAPAWGWTDPVVLGLFGLAAATFTGWVAVEIHTADPVIDLTMMRLPTVWTTNLVALFFGAGIFAVLAFVPQLTQTPVSTGYGLGTTVTGSGLVVLPMLVTMAISGSVSGPLARRVSFRAQLTISSLLSAVASAGFAFGHGTTGLVAAEGAVFGLGLGLAYAAMTSLIVQGVPAGQTGVASGMNANIRNIGGAIGTGVVSSIITGSLRTDGYPAERGYVLGFVVLTVIALAAAAVSLLIPRPDRAAGNPNPVPVPVPAQVPASVPARSGRPTREIA